MFLRRLPWCHLRLSTSPAVVTKVPSMEVTIDAATVGASAPAAVATIATDQPEVTAITTVAVVDEPHQVFSFFLLLPYLCETHIAFECSTRPILLPRLPPGPNSMKGLHTPSSSMRWEMML
ncbi:hypothetical protein GUJ93_ZPchr0013g36670 [Zizania palustris]|uniref:Uncharacterized protein n=1 Tax=Zizania palustris TaxID=103762 RepID=A0A8J6BXY6_ZIZPA|nr:hypothetical protein GUJ93_ZPchr0013g36670 [Zizania palustris]